MRRTLSLAVLAAVLASPAMAQPAPPAGARPPQSTIDRGPNTPDANRAYNGGGVVLQGAPGAPPPPPQALPPGGPPQPPPPPR